MADATAESIRRRHIERQKRRIRQMKRRRCVTVSVLIMIVFIIIIFFTPLFNIRRIEVIGNQKVSTTEIEGKLENCIGKNIFRYGTGTAENNIKSIPYVDTAKISKSFFSSKITATVTECIPAGFMEVGEKKVVVDKQLKVLEVVDSVETDIPKIEGVAVHDVNPGSVIALKNENSLKTVQLCINSIAAEGLLNGVKYISFEDSDNIKFNYQNRLDVVCGNTQNFEKKIKLFNQALNTEKLSDKSRGTIDLSVTGQAVYTP